MIRRTFIKNGSIISVLGLAPFCNNITGKSKKKLGVALVGLGYYSTNLLAPALQLTRHCELKGIVTGSSNKIPNWKTKYNIPDENIYSYETMHELANNDDIDVIYIVVPTSLHEKYAVIAANCGKHVWCEKPMAMTETECQNVIDACKKNNVKLSIGYRMQHEPNTQTIIQYAKTKPYGNLESVISQAGYHGGGGSDWRYQKDMGGGALYDMGVYTINGIRYATGMIPVEVMEAEQYSIRPNIMGDIDETTEYRLRFSNGLEAIGKTSVGENYNNLRITCKNGWYELSPMQTYNGVKGSTSDGKLLNIHIDNQQAKQMDDDALAILNNTDLMVPGEEGQIDISIVQAIIKSSEIRASVRI